MCKGGGVSLRPAELTAVAAELNRELSGGVIQKVYAPTTTRVYAELRVPGRSVTLLWCSENGVARVSAVEARPPNPATPPTWQSVLRRELTGAKVLDVEAVPQSRCLVFHLGKGERTLTWLLEASGTPGLALLTRDGTIVTLSNPFRPAFRVGATWAPPPTGSSGPVSDSVEPPSRLASDHVFLRLAHGAEALFAQVEQVTWRKAQTSPLEGRLKKI